MKHRSRWSVAVLIACCAGLVGGLTPAAAVPPDDRGPTVYVGELTAQQMQRLTESGVDRTELTTRPAGSKVAVEVVLTPGQAAKLAGLGLREKRVAGQTVSKRMRAEAASGYTVFRSYSEAGGIKDEYAAAAAAHPELAKLEVIGKSVDGQDIIALKVTRNATTETDGSRPTVLYSSTQHAREWITPEMNRRLMHHFLDSYATDLTTQRILNRTELWFVPVANPDGYDYTFTPGHRLWRKNLRDNDGDGVITGSDGVDPNRNFPNKWGYDNEGSSSSPSSETYRGTAPASEPETRALDGLMRRIRPRFLVNYHSAAELLLYGVGWQVATPSPDDQIAVALAGDDAKPAVPGYDPDISAELYTTNGETDDRAQAAYDTIAYTPEMSTCQTASAIDPDDAFDPNDCDSVFNFPDSETLVQDEYAKNLPFALSVAKSALDPDDPVSSLGLKAPDFAVNSFAVSYGSPQTVSVTARKALTRLRLHYAINGGRARVATVKEFTGGERYGDTGRKYYGEFRGQVRGARKGDSVEVWFSGRREGPTATAVTRRTSEHFTYRVATTKKADVVVIADEDYNGVNPTYPASVTKPKYAAQYVSDLRAKGISAVVWDVSKRGVPDHLGVLDHFKAALWYLGDNRLTQDPDDEQTSFFGSDVSDIAVAEREQYLTLNVRDFLNEGGRLLQTGETASYYGQLGSAVGGIYYGLNGAPDQPCVVTSDPFGDCLILADDFAQYYLGAYSRSSLGAPAGVDGTARPLTGRAVDFGGPAVADNPVDEAGAFSITSDVLPRSTYPQFASSASAYYVGGSSGPVEGSWYVGELSANDSYSRLARTVDLRSVPAAGAPSLDFAISYDTEPGYDNVIVEAHTVGADDWTTLPERSGLSEATVPADCDQGFLLEEHPFLAHYLTLGADGCTADGSTGSWNRLTGSSGGWQQVSYDLSAYAGRQVEVSVTYVTDPSTTGLGVFVDDTRVTVNGAATQAEGFESGLGAWSTPAPPPGSPAATTKFQRSQHLLAAGVTTKDTVLLGFGVEQLATTAERRAVLGRAMNYLLR